MNKYDLIVATLLEHGYYGDATGCWYLDNGELLGETLDSAYQALQDKLDKSI